MKALVLFFTFLFSACALQVYGQNPLVGTWERKTETIKATKIITPTHWIIFIESLQGGNATFVRAHGGIYTLQDNKYNEQLDVASWDNKSDYTSTDYTYTIEGDTFRLSGVLVLSDGTVNAIDEVWQKVNTARPNPDYPAIGAWNLVSATRTWPDGKKQKLSTTSASRFEIISPTHWMRISYRDNEFESAMGGTYTAEGSQAQLQVAFSSNPTEPIEKIEMSDKVARDKRYSTGQITGPGGQKITAFEEVYRKATGKPQTIK